MPIKLIHLAKVLILIGTAEPAVLHAALANRVDFGALAQEELKSLDGELVEYYFAIEHIKSYTIFSLPGVFSLIYFLGILSKPVSELCVGHISDGNAQYDPGCLSFACL